MDSLTQQSIMNNLDRLLQERGIKRSTLESGLGKSSGYISRLQKQQPDGTFRNHLSYDFLREIASYLNVSMEYLTNNAEQVTREEKSLIDFLETVWHMSTKGELFWRCVTLEQMEDGPDFSNGPIVSEVREWDEDNPESPVDQLWISWKSLNRGAGKRIDGVTYTHADFMDAYYYATIEKIDSVLYLYRVNYYGKDGKNVFPDVIEAYLEKGKEGYYLCNSLDWGEFVSVRIRDLYQSAKDSVSTARLEEGALKLLDQFNAR